MIRVAVGIIFREAAEGGGGLVLLCQRRETAKYPLKWEFPGGKVENGEGTAECLAREIHEELGLTVSSASLFHTQEAVYPDSGHYEVHYFLVEADGGAPVNKVFRRIEWVDVADLSSYDILEGNRDVVAKLLERANGPRP
jgi:8-oxo-dGTP diphosphatase